MSKHPSKKEFHELVRQWQEGEAEGNIRKRNRAAEKVLKGLEGFIWKQIHYRMKRFHPEDKEEAYSEVCIFLLTRALPKYDLERAKAEDLSFITYFSWWLRAAVSKCIDRVSLVRVPTNRHHPVLVKLARGEKLTVEEQECAPTIVYWDRQVLEKDGVSTTALSDILGPRNGLVSLPKGPELQAERDIAQEVNQLINTAVEKERDRLIVREEMYGHTLKSIGDKLGITRERVRQIRNKAHEAMRREVNRDTAIPGS